MAFKHTKDVRLWNLNCMSFNDKLFQERDNDNDEDEDDIQ